MLMPFGVTGIQERSLRGMGHGVQNYDVCNISAGCHEFDPYFAVLWLINN